MSSIILKGSSLLFTIWMLFTTLTSCNSDQTTDKPLEPISDTLIIDKSQVGFSYKMIPDTLVTIRGTIKRNQFLSEILEKYGITNSEIDQLTRNSKDIFDVRNMRAGASYTILTSSTDSIRARYMIYEHDPVNYYILDFTDSLHLRKEIREVSSELKYSSGDIETSLWNSLIDNKLNPSLAVEMSEIYAWTIDFFGLQVGDRYRIIYEEEYIDTVSIGIKKIYGAWFQHAGTDFYAIPMIQDSTESYFDLDGNSLRKAFLKAPLKFSRISSRFSNNRMHPILRIRRPHHGVDYAAPIGTPVYSIGDGKIIMAETQSGSGRIVKVKHNSVYTTAYMHLSRFGQGVKVGKYVKQGDIVGYVGSSGLSTGPHLDFRFYKNGAAVDPLKVEAPSVDPVKEENFEKFTKISTLIKDLLDNMDY